MPRDEKGGRWEGPRPSIQHIEKGEKFMDQTQLLAHCGSNKITREELRMVPTPEGTESHHPLAHNLIVEALAETLAFRSLLDETGAPLKVQQELMRHADIRTTMNIYGKAMEKSKREAHSKVVRLVLASQVA
jgi:integrase